MSFKACAIVPTYRHAKALPQLLAGLGEISLPVIVVDDGNAEPISSEIKQYCEAAEGVTLVRLDVNQGKGAAVLKGFSVARDMGFTHALQVDADGQHDLTQASQLIDMARAKPDHLISAEPVYDDSMPISRRIGRQITHFWVAINTLSFRFIDSMCGFRVYPLQASLALAETKPLAQRMGFDIDILVRLLWQGTPLSTLPVKVVYPVGNYSNFKPADNIEVSKTHAKLFFLMLRKLPGQVFGGSYKRQVSGHWSELGERGSYLGLWLLAMIYRVFGRTICLVVMSPVVLFFFITGRDQRKASIDFLNKAWKLGMIDQPASAMASLKHFMTFGAAALDKFAAWTGNISIDQVDGADSALMREAMDSQRGGFIMTAHLGNVEVIRAVASLSNRFKINVLVHTANAVRFNQLIQNFTQSSTVQLFQVTQIGPDTAMILQAAVDRGEWVVMVGDRVPVSNHARVTWTNFMGEIAPFAQGPHILGSLLQCPVYLLFCLRIDGRFRIFFEPFAERIVLSRKTREQAIAASVSAFAARLEHYVRLAPFQWFNFFDYWHPAGVKRPNLDATNIVESELVH